MATPTFNAHCDYFGIAGATAKCTGSSENISKQTANGQNTPGDIVVVDAYGETAAPSSEYEVIDVISALPVLGTVRTAAELAAETPDATVKVDGTARPVVLGSLSVSTQMGSAPTISASGQAIMAGETVAKRNFNLPALASAGLKPIPRAQDFLGLCTINKGANAADPVLDYGLSSVNASFPINIIPAAPNGEMLNYDLTSGMATVDYTMNWYASTPPSVSTVSTLTLNLANGATKTVPVVATQPAAKSTQQNGYTQYSWQVSFPLIGFDIESGS